MCHWINIQIYNTSYLKYKMESGVAADIKNQNLGKR